MGKHGRSRGTSWTKLVWPPTSWIVMGKAISKKLYWNLGGRKYRIGNVSSFIENKGYFCQYMWMTSKWLERSNIWIPSNGLLDCSHQPSWVSLMRQHVANGARGCGPWYKLVSRLYQLSARVGALTLSFCIVSWPRILGMYSASMQTEWNDYWTMQREYYRDGKNLTRTQ